MAIPRACNASRSFAIVSALAIAWALGGCAFKASPPDGFAQYPRSRWFGAPLRATSPDGVLFTVRTEANDPPADLAFWREALKTRMGHAGYRVVADTVCPMAGSEGVLLKLAAPVGNQDYFYWIAFTLSPSRKKIVVAEAAGESKHFLARQNEITRAIAASGF